MGENSNSNSSAQRINLFCPSLSKLATIVAWNDHRLDLGTIARTFGIDPHTLKLNGHFISRGADLIASSLTWSSLLSFFSARGLSTGTAASTALIVDGKLLKSGAKRGPHDPVELNPQSTPKKMKSKEIQSGCINQDGLGPKRKKMRMEAISRLKRSRTDGCYSHSLSKSAPRFTCSYQSERIKREREEQVLVEAASACKRRQ